MDLDFETCYRAVSSRDARFDGWFITGVTSTGIYCRPSCPAMTPKRANVRFFPTAAAAHAAGLRACKRCLPDASPGSPEWNVRGDVVARAMRLISDGVVDRDGVAELAGRLHFSERHIHRLLVEELGAGPQAIARAQRAQTARTLIERTKLRFAEIAFAAGFNSIRQFNDTMKEVYAHTPTELRRKSKSGTPDIGGAISLKLAFRKPFDGASVLSFLGTRAVPGVEEFVSGTYRRTLDLPHSAGIVELAPSTDQVDCTLRLGDVRDLQAAVQRCRALLDLDADPVAVDEMLGRDPLLRSSVRRHPGRRVPGVVDGAELAFRAVLGQQVSVKGARTLAGRLVDQLGKPLTNPDGGLTHVFPRPGRDRRRGPHEDRHAGQPAANVAELGVCAGERRCRPRPRCRPRRDASAPPRDTRHRPMDVFVHRDACTRRSRRVPSDRPRRKACADGTASHRRPIRCSRAMEALARLRGPAPMGQHFLVGFPAHRAALSHQKTEVMT